MLRMLKHNITKSLQPLPLLKFPHQNHTSLNTLANHSHSNIKFDPQIQYTKNNINKTLIPYKINKNTVVLLIQKEPWNFISQNFIKDLFFNLKHLEKIKNLKQVILQTGAKNNSKQICSGTNIKIFHNSHQSPSQLTSYIQSFYQLIHYLQNYQKPLLIQTQSLIQNSAINLLTNTPFTIAAASTTL